MPCRLAAALAAMSCAAAALGAQVPIAIRNVTIIPMTGAHPSAGQTVLVRDGRIAEIGATRAVRVPAGAVIVDGTGRFLIPGLFEMHAHTSKARASSLALHVAHGVTTIRDQGSEHAEVLRWRREIRTGERVGPRMLIAGPYLESLRNIERMRRDPPESRVEPFERARIPIGSPADARGGIDSLSALELDHFKVRTVQDRDSYLALARAAHARGKRLTGHVVATTPELFLEAGQDGVDHGFPIGFDSLPRDGRMAFWRELARRDVGVVPTLVTITASVFRTPDYFRALLADTTAAVHSLRPFLSKFLLLDWREQVEEATPERRAYFDRAWPIILKHTREMREAGVRLMTGSDLAVLNVFPGDALHEELRLLVDSVGMTPLEALASATVKPAEWLGLRDSVGTIAVGKVADLVLLDGNPLVSISNTRRIAAVLLRGSLLQRPELSALLASVARMPDLRTNDWVRPPPSPDERLTRLYTEEWNWRQREMARSGQPGEGGGTDHFPRVDAASQQARLAYWTRALATLDSIPFDSLSTEGKINAQVFRAAISALATDVKYKTYEAPFNSDTFFWTEFTPRQGFASVAAYRNYLGRLRDVPRYFADQIANMRAGLARGYTVPRVSTIGRDRTIEPYLRPDSANPLYAAFTRMPPGIPAADQAALRADALTAIREIVAPAYGRLLDFMRGEYLPRTRTTLAAADLPDGNAFYQAMIEKFTTLTLTARQIHDIGLAEVARIEAEMVATKERAGFKGSMAAFFRFLRTDPQFYAKTPRELLSYSAYISKKADGKLSQTIGFLPRFRHGILPVPETLAPIYTGGRGGLESCLMNTYNLPARPLYTIAPLTLHECTPGHSFQAALALEGPERPPFRRGAGFSGYTEGWGLYTEWLGREMGIYETPYEEFGQLAYEMWRACRLVIDTGIHQYGWSRERAMDYLRTRAPLSEHEITTEVERYIAWPAQALAYKLGEIQIRRHRREAEAALGARFDQRAFHDAILALGAVPLPVLEQRMAEFIAEARHDRSL